MSGFVISYVFVSISRRGFSFGSQITITPVSLGGEGGSGLLIDVKTLVTICKLQLTMPDTKSVKLLSWTDGDAGRRFGWKTVTVVEALKSSEKHFRCATCDGPVKLVRKKSEKAGGHPEHLKIGVGCATPLVSRTASTKKTA
jgi:hypothetical protein